MGCAIETPFGFDHPAPADFIPKLTAIGGTAMGVEHAVLFRAHDPPASPELFTASPRPPASR
jgi:hypothetical protein